LDLKNITETTQEKKVGLASLLQPDLL